MRRNRLILFALALTAAIPPALADEVPKDLAGTYAPAGDCNREPRLTVDAQGILVQSGGRQSKLAPVSVCHSCAGGARYQGIEIWIGPSVKGDQPFYFRFNADERRGRVIAVQNDTKVPPIVGVLVKGSPYLPCKPK